MKVMYLALRNLAAKWNRLKGWHETLYCFVLLWQDRFPQQHG
jgi:hypothetical protein